MTKIKKCYTGHDLEEIDLHKGESYHHGVENINRILSGDDYPDAIYTEYEDDEEGCKEEEIGCIDCKSDPDYIYCGKNLPHINVRKGDSFESVFESINAKVQDVTNHAESTVILKNSLGKVLLTEDIDPGTTEEIFAPDGTAVIQYADGTPIMTAPIPSGVSKTIPVPNPDWAEFRVVNKTSLTIAIGTSNSNNYVVDWGDGNVITYASNSWLGGVYTYNTHNYNSSFTGKIKVRIVGGYLYDVVRFSLNMAKINIAELLQFRNLRSIVLTGADITGDISLLYLLNNLDYEIVLTDTYVTGDISGFGALSYRFSVTGNNSTLTGDISGFTNLSNQLTVRGNGNIITGNLDSITQTIERIFITGDNNVISCDLSTKSNVKGYFNLSGNLNTITGNIADLTSIGTSSIYDTSLMLQLSTNTSIATYTSKLWTNAGGVYIRLSSGHLTSAEVDQILIDLANSTNQNIIAATIDLRGNNQPRTSASSSAASNLLGRGLFVLTN